MQGGSFPVEALRCVGPSYQGVLIGDLLTVEGEAGGSGSSPTRRGASRMSGSLQGRQPML